MRREETCSHPCRLLRWCRAAVTRVSIAGRTRGGIRRVRIAGGGRGVIALRVAIAILPLAISLALALALRLIDTLGN